MHWHEQPRLNLPRALMLLAIDAVQGKVRPSSGLRLGLVAAALIELAWQRRLRGDSRSLTLIDSRPSDDATLEPILRAMRWYGPANTVRMWILHLARDVYDIDNRVLAVLEHEGVLRKQPRRILGFLPIDCYPLAAPGVQIELRATVRQAVRFVPAPNEPMLALIGLLRACDLLGAVFSRQEAYAFHKRLSQLHPSDTTSRLIIETLDQAIRDGEHLASIVGIG